MSWLFAHRNVGSNESKYATDEDFRKLFTKDANSLYLLSFLLTANLDEAERCFVAGLDDCENESSVFNEWALSWARHIIVRNAIRIVAPHCGPGRTAPGALHPAGGHRFPRMPLEYARFANVLALEDFERFVFVLSVLESYPEQECAVLLGASRQEIRDTRVRSLQHVADFEPKTATPGVGFSRNEVFA